MMSRAHLLLESFLPHPVLLAWISGIAGLAILAGLVLTALRPALSPDCGRRTYVSVSSVVMLLSGLILLGTGLGLYAVFVGGR